MSSIQQDLEDLLLNYHIDDDDDCIIRFDDWHYYFNKIVSLTKGTILNIKEFSFSNGEELKFNFEIKNTDGFLFSYYIEIFLFKIKDEFLIFSLRLYNINISHNAPEIKIDSSNFIELFKKLIQKLTNYYNEIFNQDLNSIELIF